jgi:hypothetical protein
MRYILIEQADCWEIMRLGKNEPVAEITKVEANFARYIVETLNYCAFRNIDLG